MGMFNKNITPCCTYCSRSRSMGDNEPLLCSKAGVVSPEYGCKNFKYDPLKRVPVKINNFSRFSDEEFSLDVKDIDVNLADKMNSNTVER